MRHRHLLKQTEVETKFEDFRKHQLFDEKKILKHEHTMCTERLFVRFRSSLFVKIIYKCTKHYNYLHAYLHLAQTYLQASKLLKTYIYKHKSN